MLTVFENTKRKTTSGRLPNFTNFVAGIGMHVLKFMRIPSPTELVFIFLSITQESQLESYRAVAGACIHHFHLTRNREAQHPCGRCTDFGGSGPTTFLVIELTLSHVILLFKFSGGSAVQLWAFPAPDFGSGYKCSF